MSEVNENQDLNEEINYEIDDADVIPMPIDPTLTHPGEAADAKATGDAIRGMGANININGVRADLTGTFHVYPASIPMSGEQGAQTVEQVLNDIGGRTGADIVTDAGSTTTIAEALESIEESLSDKISIEDIDASLEQVGKVADAHATGEAIQSLGESIEEALSELDEKTVKSVNDISPDESGNVSLRVAPLAENLLTSKTHESVGEFVIRTADVDASIEDGAAYVQSIKGNSVHTGEVQEVLEMTVTPIEREEPITATLNEATFREYVQESTVVTLYYTSEWSADPTLYGINVIGTPVAGDQININYVVGSRGLISNATPTKISGTGWNLYDSVTGYARLVKYSDQYGFYVGGSFDSLAFAETINGARTPVVVSDHKFNIPSDGYVFVQGGDSNSTYIVNTWSDWVSGCPEEYQPYTEIGVEIASIMTQVFPDGLMRVGSVRDEIDFVTQEAISRIERMEYTTENLNTVIASGRPYDADENYIYTVRQFAAHTPISLDGAYTVSDHGNELFSGTTVPVYAEILYGVNLKNKLERDTITYSAQSETAARQAQARTNIGAASQADFTALNGKFTLIDNTGDSGSENLTFAVQSDGRIQFILNTGTVSRVLQFGEDGIVSEIKGGAFIWTTQTMFKTKTVTATLNVAANTAYTGTIPFTPDSGYTPIAIAGWNIIFNRMAIYRLHLAGNNIQLSLQNFHTAAMENVSANFYVLEARTQYT